MFIKVPSQQPASQLTETAQNTVQITKDNKQDIYETKTHTNQTREF
jgi:hypothetical protein